MDFFSPAKVNLFLRVLGRRSDGYHEIASLFQALDLGDTLSYAFSETDQFTTTDPRVPSTLIFRAVDLFRQATEISFHITIHLDKKIPMEAGLGGGSSNAATTLWALNILHGSPLSTQELQTLSTRLGSDVPFFFSTGTAYCTGRGEMVRDLPPLNLSPLKLTKPTEGLSTPKIYNTLDLSQCSQEDPEHLLASFLNGEPRLLNDLEAPAFHLLPKLAQMKSQLEQAGSPSLMTGSGTALFSLSQSGTVHPLNRTQNVWFKG